MKFSKKRKIFNRIKVTSNLALFFSLVVFIYYVFGIVDYGFFIWDDKYFFLNEIILQKSVLGVFLNSHYGLYHPVTTLIVKFTYLISNNNASFLHFTTILIHSLNTVLFYFLLNRFKINSVLSYILASLFLIHPTVIETYAWITNIKDLISISFLLITINYYLSNKTTITFGLNKKYIIYNILVLLTLLSKPTTVFLPFAILLYDLILENQLKLQIVLKQVFAIAFAIVLIIISLQIRNNYSTISLLPNYNVWERIALMFYNWIIYTLSVIIPHKQSIFYTYPFKSGEISLFYYLTYLIPITLILRNIWKRWKYTLLIIISFVILLPVLQLIPISESVRNDRYSSVYTMYLLLLIGLAWKNFTTLKSKTMKFLLYSVFLVFCTNLFITFVNRINEWRSVETLLKADYSKYPNSEILGNTLGVYYLNQGQYSEAIPLFQKAISIDRAYVQAINNLGRAYYLTGQLNKSELCYLHSIKTFPIQYEAYKQLSILFYKRNEYNQADSILNNHFSQNDDEALNLLGKIKYQKGFIAESIYYHESAIKISTKSEYFYDLAISYGAISDFNKALLSINDCIKNDPQLADAYYLRGIIYYNLGLDPCSDLKLSEKLGYKKARKAIEAYCVN